jgi:hypothetical protein
VLGHDSPVPLHAQHPPRQPPQINQGELQCTAMHYFCWLIFLRSKISRERPLGASTDRYGCPGVPGGEVNGAKALTILQDEGLIVGSHGEGYFVKR